MSFPISVNADVVLTYGRDRKSSAAKDLGLARTGGFIDFFEMVQGELFEAALVSVVKPIRDFCRVYALIPTVLESSVCI
jgi:hypothetical protein